MFNINKITNILIIVGLLFYAQMAHAAPKPWIWSWWPSHWENLDFEPYIEPAKEPHNSQWNNSGWTPEDWIKRRESGLRLIKDLYYANILKNQYTEDDMPVLVVGPAFYRLGGEDKRRVVETVDHVYEVTSNELFGMFMIHDWRTKKAIGAYTPYGLQLQ